MEVKFKNDYSYSITKYSKDTFEGNLEDGIKQFIDWVMEDTFESEDDLKDTFEEYIRDNADLVPDFSNTPGDIELDDYSIKFEITNWEEIFPLLAYLVVSPPVLTCCDKAPKGSNFCPTCGKSLK